MNKICLIVCYFGQLPNYFHIWEKSASKNSRIDFIIFSDQKYKSKYKNIIFEYITIDEINELFSKKLGLNITIKKPYKFCDFRPAYGVIFEDYIKKYDFWGHCDIDQVFGDISSFINEKILNEFERINHLGHFCLYKNIEKVNNLYKLTGSPFDYREVFTSEENYAFDEISGIDMIVKKENISNYEIENIADIDVKHKRYRINNFKNYNKQFFIYESGKLYYLYYKNNKLNKTEMMYLHFQKKKPIIKIDDYEKTIYIGKDMFSNIKNENCNSYNSIIFEFGESILYYIKKIIAFINSSSKEKKIWLKQKGKKIWKTH